MEDCKDNTVMNCIICCHCFINNTTEEINIKE